MKKYDVIIIGGGASGIMCAMQIKNKKVLIIEKQDKIGKKILVKGNGRCNFTNRNCSSHFYNTDKVLNFFKKFSNHNALTYFSNLGLSFYYDDEGRYYPTSNYASSMLDVMRLNLNKLNNVEILTNCTANKIFYNKEYCVSTNIGEYFCDNLIFACGGNFSNIFDFNIPYIPFTPSLCGLKTEKNKGLNGVKQKNVKVSLINNETHSQQGEILFKDNGVSGICIFNLSNYYNPSTKNVLKIDLLPDISYQDLVSLITKRCSLFDNNENLLVSLFQKQLSLSIMQKSNINIDGKTKDLTKTDVSNIASTIKEYSLYVYGLENNNQIYKGGIDLDDLDENLEHKKYKNLYFIGESCNVSGECGGYNLQWCWTSGKIVGDYINNK